MIKMCLQFFGGRGSAGGNNPESSSNSNESSFFGTKTITANNFSKHSIGDINIWESKVQIIDAAALTRDKRGRATGAIKSTVPAYTIIQEGEKFRIYRTIYGGRRKWLKNEKSFDKAVKFVDKYHKGEIE